MSRQGTVVLYAGICLLAVAIFFCVYLPGFQFNLPLAYQDDALFSSLTIKTIMDTGWYLTNAAIGFPNGYHFADFPVAETINLFLIKAIANFTDQYAVVLNIFYLLTFPLIAVISFPVFQRVGLNQSFALAACLLYTFLPYHLLRGEYHLFLTTYYVVPLLMLLILSVYEKDFLNVYDTQGSLRWKIIGFLLFLCILIASSGVYYAFFGAYFILLASMLAGIERKRLLKALLLVGLIGATLIINISPGMMERYHAGSNKIASYRAAFDSETYGLKVTQLLFPVDNHHLRGFAKSKSHYNKTAPLVNENTVATLGIIGALGFLFLLISLFQKLPSPIFFLLNRLNLFAVLLGTIGGLGAVFAYRISPLIRSYNRISIFIAFFALCGFFLVLQAALKKWSKVKPWQMLLLSLMILLIGLWDEIPAGLTANQPSIRQSFLSDQQFVNQIEKSMPVGSAIFQLPFMFFPESPPINQMHDYDPTRAYLHSKQLRWSYGAIHGRSVSDWQDKISQQSLLFLLKDLKSAGFSGLYIDRFGYPDRGATIEQSVHKIPHRAPLISPDNRFIFYDIR